MNYHKETLFDNQRQKKLIISKNFEIRSSNKTISITSSNLVVDI